MRVVLANHVANNTGGLHIGPIVGVVFILHREQDAPMYRLQAVPNVRQCAGDDDAHRIVKEGLAQLVLDVDRRDFAFKFRHGLSSKETSKEASKKHQRSHDPTRDHRRRLRREGYRGPLVNLFVSVLDEPRTKPSSDSRPERSRLAAPPAGATSVGIYSVIIYRAIYRATCSQSVQHRP